MFVTLKCVIPVNDSYPGYMQKALSQLFENRPYFESVAAWINRQVILAVSEVMAVASSFGVDSKELKLPLSSST